MKRCTKCILPETIPNITFDEQGVCNYCHGYKAMQLGNEEDLLDLFKKYPGKDYDVVLGLSGGRDSSFALYLLTQVYKKKVLAVHYKSPLSHEQGTLNAIAMAKALDTELVIITDKEDLHKKCFSNNVRAYYKKPSISMVSMMCIACKVKWIDIFDLAKQHGVRLVVAGSNPFEESSFKLAFQGIKEGSKHLYLKRFLKGVSEIIKNPRYINKDTFLTTLRAYVYLDSKSPMLKLIYPGIRKIDLFYYLDWDENTVVDTIRKYGWEKPDEAKTSWRFDCLVGKMKDYIYYSNYGFTEKDDFYSKLIRENKMTREDALSRINQENQEFGNEENLGRCLGVCGMTMAELKK